MVGIATAVATLGSAAIGAISSAQQNKRARSILQQQKSDNQNWYNTRMSEDFTNRVDSQAIITRQRELLDEQARNARGANAVAGGTPESEAIAKAQANSSLAQTMSDIAAQGAAYKDSVEQAYRQQDAALRQQVGQIAHNQAMATAQAAGQAVNAGINLLGNQQILGADNYKPTAKQYAKAQSTNYNNAIDGMKAASAQYEAQRVQNQRNSIFKGIK